MLVVIDVVTRLIIGFGIERGSIDGMSVCRMFNHASVPYAPVSHPFVGRLIGTIRREYLDRVFFWNAIDLARKLEAFRHYYNGHRVHRAIAEVTREQRAGALRPTPAELDHYGWQRHGRGLFELPIEVLTPACSC